MSARLPFSCAITVGFATVVAAISAGAADWPMQGRDRSRNAVVADAKGPTDWVLPADGKEARHVLWSAKLGYNSQGDPVVSQGLVWVGTNSGLRAPAREEDAGALMCFDERDGTFLYQYLSPRLPDGGRSPREDWPGSSQGGSPLVEKDRLWFCNNRCEVICLDIAPLIARTGSPKVLWKVDLRRKFNVVPRAVMMGSNTSQCSVAGYKDWIYVNTANSADYDGRVPSPLAPSLICFEKETGRVKWQDNSPGQYILDVQQGSPLVAEIQGRTQVVMGQGDGWLRSFDAMTGEFLWKFDINPKRSEDGEPLERKERNDLVAMPVLADGRLFFATGRHHESAFGPGRVCCVDPTKRGDVSGELSDETGPVRPNPNSGLIWEYSGVDGPLENRMGRTISSVVVHKGLVIAPSTNGILHCIDAATGKGVWVHDLLTYPFCSPLIVGDRIYMASEAGVSVLDLAREKRIIAENDAPGIIESSPVYANGTLYLMTRNRLYAIRQ